MFNEIIVNIAILVAPLTKKQNKVEQSSTVP